MGLPKNRTNHPNENYKGSKNKTSELIRAAILELIENNPRRRQRGFNDLVPNKHRQEIAGNISFDKSSFNYRY